VRLAQHDDMVHALAPDRSDHLSAKPFCQGEPGAMGLSRMPIALSRRVAARRAAFSASSRLFDTGSRGSVTERSLPLTLGDSVTQSKSMRFSVHTVGHPRPGMAVDFEDVHDAFPDCFVPECFLGLCRERSANSTHHRGAAPAGL
jgi:hypothetical protein